MNLKYQFYAAPVAVGSAGFGAFYALPSLVPLTWPSIYGYNTSQIGLFLMSSGFGFIAGSLLGGYMADKVFQVWKVRRGGVIVAEDRLRSTVISMVLYPLGLLLYGWPVDHHISAAVPTIGMFIMGFSSMIINTSTNSYMLDCFTTNAAAVVAVSNFVRFVAAGVVPLVAYPIANAIGQGWFMTILAALNVATYVWLVYIQEYGTGIRVKSEPWSKSLEVVRGDEIVKFSRTKARRSPWYLRLIDKADITITPDDMDEIDRLARARLGMPEESNEKDKAAALGEEVVVVSEGGKDQLGEAVPAEKKGDEGGSSATDSVGNGSK